MTDFRALCAELLNEAIYLGSLPYEQDPDYELATRARVALAQPEQQGLMLEADDISPAAQAVKDAAFSAYWSAEQEAPNDAHVIAAAALRAVVERLGYEQELDDLSSTTLHLVDANCLLAIAAELHEGRRPKPPSLKEQALEMLENAWEGGHISNKAAQTIRRALEALND